MPSSLADVLLIVLRGFVALSGLLLALEVIIFLARKVKAQCFDIFKEWEALRGKDNSASGDNSAEVALDKEQKTDALTEPVPTLGKS